jgi:hypothetical protein
LVSFKGRTKIADGVMNGSERTNEAAENPAEEKGHQKDTNAPEKSRDETVPRQKGGQSDERIELEEEGDRLVQSYIAVGRKGNGIINIDILGESALNHKKKKQTQKSRLDDSSKPNQMPDSQMTTFFMSSFEKS